MDTLVFYSPWENPQMVFFKISLVRWFDGSSLLNRNSNTCKVKCSVDTEMNEAWLLHSGALNVVVSQVPESLKRKWKHCFMRVVWQTEHQRYEEGKGPYSQRWEN